METERILFFDTEVTADGSRLLDIGAIKENKFFDLNPILAGFLTALLTAALFEELVKYILFRLALIKNEEVMAENYMSINYCFYSTHMLLYR